MTPCKAKLASPDPHYLSGLELKAEANPCPLRKGGSSTQKTSIENHRGAYIHNVEVSIKPRFGAVVLHYDATITEHVHTVAAIGSGRSHAFSCPIEANPSSSISTEEIEIGLVLLDDSQYPSGITEQATLRYTIDVS